MPAEPTLLRLADGRQLAWSAQGPADGLPVLHFHGIPGSRLQVHPDPAIPRDLGVRLVTVDRPGMGHSSFQPHRRLLDWPHDAAALADALGWQRFGVIGVSGGCPYALATAFKLGPRVRAVALVSGLAPIQVRGVLRGMLWGGRLGLCLARLAPWLLHAAMPYAAQQMRLKPDWGPKRMVLRLPPDDERIRRRPEIRRLFADDFAEATRQGIRGLIHDAHLLASPWGFRPEELRPGLPVHLWHGDEDTIVPIAMGQYHAQAIPGCQATFIPGGGHYLVFDHYRHILATLAAHLRK
jgi:pimeloyl-ACP methyl ester carboxylesterase